MEMWGGVECTVNRVQDAYFTQLDRNGHHRRDDDLDRFVGLGLRAIRYPVLWEAIAPERIAAADKSQLHRLLPPVSDYRPRGLPNSRDSSQIGITITAPSRK